MAALSKNWRWVAAAAGLAFAAAFLLMRGGADGAAPAGRFETAAVDRGAVVQSIATSGSVRPLVTVQVGSQLSGQVAELFADFNTEVTEGQLIARIDPQTFQTRVEAARADKAVAEATLVARRADMRRAQAFTEQHRSNLERYESLGEEAGLAEIEMDALRAQLSAARADLDAAQAQVTNAEALVAQRNAALQQADVDLARTEIRSPVDGVVILRSVDVGQTVAASLSAPILFEIARDLSRIQIEADVNEADIGAVDAGDEVTFTVDAYPGRDFSGVVETVRLAPTELQNVVTYTVIIHADNPGRVLYPGMTATVEIMTGRREGILRIPNAAARFEPANAAALLGEARERRQGQRQGQGGRGGARLAMLAEELSLTDEQQTALQEKMRSAFGGGRGSGGPGGPDPTAQDRQKRFNAALKSVLTDEQWRLYEAGLKDRPQPKTIWVLNAEDEIEPRRVRLGLSDGSFTEIVGDRLEEGERVVIRERADQS